LSEYFDFFTVASYPPLLIEVTVECCLKSLFTLRTVVRQQCIAEEGKRITFRCQGSSVYQILLESGDFIVLFKVK